MIVIEGWALVTFGLFRPRFSDLLKSALSLFILALAIFCVNVLLRRSGLHPRANYFFTVETEGISLLELFHSWIPVPFLYLLPSIVILLPYMIVVTGAFAVVERMTGKKAEKQPQ